jgi:hypothetical protein
MNTRSARKKNATVMSVAVTHGMSARFRSRFCRCTTVEKRLRMSDQKRSEPFCPPHSAATTYCVGSELDEYAATYSSEKSCCRSARRRIAVATTTSAKTA